jgi:AraC-like DNA-binding protein
MLSRETPLRGHTLFQSASAADLCREIRDHLGATCVVAPVDDVDVNANRYELPSGELCYLDTRTPLEVHVPEGPFIRTQVQRAGFGTTYINQQPHCVNERQSCISPAQAVLEFGAGFQQLVWRVGYDVLVRKLVALTGSPVARRLTFEPTIQRDGPGSKAFVAILNCILANIEHATVLGPPFVLAELEEALIVSMLFNFSHNMREQLDQEVLDAGSWQVKRVEEYIEAHLEAPFDIERIAAVTGISTRSIYRAFKRSRGYSPMAFARQRRLQRARQMLEEAETNQTVTSVAFVCGFNDVGHFSREFSKAFGKAPSAVLGKRPR